MSTAHDKQALLTEAPSVEHASPNSDDRKRTIRIRIVTAISLLVVLVAVVLLTNLLGDDGNSSSSSIDICPGHSGGTPLSRESPTPTLEENNEALLDLDIEAVVQDISVLLNSLDEHLLTRDQRA